MELGNNIQRGRVYIETSIISVLTARPSMNMHSELRRQLTRTWWDRDRAGFELFASPLVLAECEAGDPVAAERRLDVLRAIPFLEMNDEALRLAQLLMEINAVPPEAQDDALHVAVAAVHRLDFLLTWNCRHIDNAVRKPLMRQVCQSQGYQCAEICTPEELMGGLDERA
jgi:predicted nucleic acid-binding protein